MGIFDTFILGVQSKYRGQELELSLKEQNFSYKNIWGIDATEVSTQDIEIDVNQMLSKLFVGRELHRGEIACLEVHQRAYKTFSKTENDWVLILEDDAEVPRLNIPLISKILQSIKGPAIIQLFPPVNRTEISSEEFITEAGNSFFLNKNFSLGKGTYAYFVNKDAVRIILKGMRNRKFCSPADWPINWKGRIRAYSVKPRMAFHNDSAKSVVDLSMPLEIPDHPAAFDRRFSGDINLWIRWRYRLLMLTGILPFLFILNGINPLYIFKEHLQEIFYKMKRSMI
jgi:hypothetical protein